MLNFFIFDCTGIPDSADSGMILQRHERGDYIITDKGYKTLMAISALSSRLNGT